MALKDVHVASTGWVIQQLRVENSRAGAIETGLRSDLTAETTRAVEKETQLQTDLTAEIDRSTQKDNELASALDTTNANLAEEITRAKTAENKKLDKDKIISDLSVSSYEDDNVPSAKVVYDELAKKINLSAIATAWHAEPTDDFVPSEKLVKNLLDTKFAIDNIKSEWSDVPLDTNVASEKLTKDTFDKIVADFDTKLNKAIADLIDGAPETYDTLKEVADFIANHSVEFESLMEIAGNKIDKSNLVNEWSETLSTENVPSEKLVKDTINQYFAQAAGASQTVSDKVIQLDDKVDELQAALSGEIERAGNAENQLQDAIDILESKVGDGYAGIDERLTNEISRAVGEDERLDALIGAETTRAKAAEESKLGLSDVITAWNATPSNTKVASEALIKGTLDGKLSMTAVHTSFPASEANLEDTAVPSEKLVYNSIQQLRESRMEKEGELQAQITGEKTRAQEKEQDLEGRIGDLVVALEEEAERAKAAEAVGSENKFDKANIVTGDFSVEPSDEKVVSEKLVKEKFDAVESDITDLKNDKVDKSNIATELSLNPSDEKIVSEKLLSDTIDAINTNIGDKLDRDQLITEWSDTPSNEKIASEKLVKTAIASLATGVDECVEDDQIVTSWSDVTSDTNIPSEKLVKTYLDQKVNKSQVISTYDVATVQDDDILTAKYVQNALDTKLNTSEVVTSTAGWSINPKETTVPSEKLVKLSLDQLIERIVVLEEKVNDLQINAFSVWSGTRAEFNVASGIDNPEDPNYITNNTLIIFTDDDGNGTVGD